jgi:hypothetical protein
MVRTAYREETHVLRCVAASNWHTASTQSGMVHLCAWHCVSVWSLKTFGLSRFFLIVICCMVQTLVPLNNEQSLVTSAKVAAAKKATDGTCGHVLLGTICFDPDRIKNKVKRHWYEKVREAKRTKAGSDDEDRDSDSDIRTVSVTTEMKWVRRLKSKEMSFTGLCSIGCLSVIWFHLFSDFFECRNGDCFELHEYSDHQSPVFGWRQ